MKKIAFVFALLIASKLSWSHTEVSKETMRRLIKENFSLADSQYRYMMTLTPPDKLPQSYDAKDNRFISGDIGWWCSGFYPGTLWYIYEQTTKCRSLKLIRTRCSNSKQRNKHDFYFSA